MTQTLLLGAPEAVLDQFALDVPGLLGHRPTAQFTGWKIGAAIPTRGTCERTGRSPERNM